VREKKQQPTREGGEIPTYILWPQTIFIKEEEPMTRDNLILGTTAEAKDALLHGRNR